MYYELPSNLVLQDPWLYPIFAPLLGKVRVFVACIGSKITMDFQIVKRYHIDLLLGLQSNIIIYLVTCNEKATLVKRRKEARILRVIRSSPFAPKQLLGDTFTEN